MGCDTNWRFNPLVLRMSFIGDTKTASQVSRPALLALGLYMIIAGAVGEVWPFSRFTMYANIPKNAAVPMLKVNGEDHFPEEFVDFFGCTAEQIRLPHGIPSRVRWRQDEIGHWVSRHSAANPGDVAVDFGYQMVTVDDGVPRLDPSFVPLCSGSARWKK